MHVHLYLLIYRGIYLKYNFVVILKNQQQVIITEVKIGHLKRVNFYYYFLFSHT